MKVDARTWYHMTTEQREDHVKRFRSYAPTPTDFYKKPQSVGKKPGDKSRKRPLTEPTFVEERVPKVTIKRKNNSFSATATVAIDLEKINPKASLQKPMELRLKSMHKAVTR